jgi:hypothetical protein
VKFVVLPIQSKLPLPCILDEVLLIIEKAEIKPDDTKQSDDLSAVTKEGWDIDSLKERLAATNEKLQKVKGKRSTVHPDWVVTFESEEEDLKVKVAELEAKLRALLKLTDPMNQVAIALGRGFDVRADTLKKKEQASDNRVMMLLKQAGLSEAAAYQCRPKDGERASSCPRLGHSNRGVAHYSASARPSNNLDLAPEDLVHRAH